MSECYIKPIGIYSCQQQSHISQIQLDSAYWKGTLHLDKFSHLLVFYRKGDQLVYDIVAIKEVFDQEKRIILGENKLFEGDYEVYDIKPYFPCEDRISREKLLNHQSPYQCIHPIEMVAADELKQAKLYEKFHEREMASLKKLTTLATIRILHGVYYLVFNQQIPDALADMKYIRILWWFHGFDKKVYRNHMTCNPPYDNAPMTGMFASRSPVRPNPIAITTAVIKEIDYESNRIEISKLDAFDGTKVIGIKSYEDWEIKENVMVPQWLKHWPDCYRCEVEDEEEDECKINEINMSLEDQLQRMNLIHPQVQPEFQTEKCKTKSSSMDHIEVCNARENNLKNVSVQIPYNQITVVTGVSGSGKSSLVFDTIYAESQRRFFSNLHVPGLDQVHKPDVDEINGLPPAIAVSQTEAASQPRSTVGTYTDLYEILCKIYAQVGRRFCPECGNELLIYTEDEIRNLLEGLKDQTKVWILPYQSTGQMVEYRSESLHEMLMQGNGAIQIQMICQKEEIKFVLQTNQLCHHCGKIMFEMTPSLFKFNQPESMCLRCKGLGVSAEVSVQKIITDENKSILDGASPWWKEMRKFLEKPTGNWMKGELVALAQQMHVDLSQSWVDLPEEFKKKALYGTGDEILCWTIESKNGRSGSIRRPISGAVKHIQRLYEDNKSVTGATTMDEFMEYKECPCCHGERLNKEGRSVVVAGKRLPELVHMSLVQLMNWIYNIPEKISAAKLAMVKQSFEEIYQRLKDYVDAGLCYLTLARAIPTFSGGEFNRMRLVAQLRNGMSHMLYIFDEPSRGLHPKNYEMLFHMMEALKKNGNTVLIVEHSRSFMKQSDYMIEIGLGASKLGGTVVMEGKTNELLENASSKTLQYLSNQLFLMRQIQSIKECSWMEIRDITYHNLKQICVKFPRNRLTCITGISGSGKSSLFQVIYQAFSHEDTDSDMAYTMVNGSDIRRVQMVDQKPIGKTSRSTPATYCGILDPLRKIYAMTEEAKKQNYSLPYFSYNTTQGQCDVCKGTGEVSLSVGFASNLHTECSACHGKRYKAGILKIPYQNKSIADVLKMSVDEAFDWILGSLAIEEDAKIKTELNKLQKLLKGMQEIGVGYLSLGQSCTTISGGEAQRMKLMTYLKESKEETLFLLDEPTTGLHFSDIQNLLKVIDQLIANGNTMILIEHNTEVINLSDWIIDLGPEAGENGGTVIGMGTPEEISECQNGSTGKYLKEWRVSIPSNILN